MGKLRQTWLKHTKTPEKLDAMLHMALHPRCDGYVAGKTEEKCRDLLAAGAKPHETILHGMISEWDGEPPAELVDMLISAKADMNYVRDNEYACRSSRLPLVIAIERGFTQTALKMIASGADVNKTSYHDVSVLMAASEKGNDAVVTALLQKNPDIEHTGKSSYYRRNALNLAARAGAYTVVDKLLNAGAQINQRDDFKDWSTIPLFAATYTTEEGTENAIKTMAVLLRHGADIQETDHKNERLLDHAIYNKSAAVTAFVLERGDFKVSPGNMTLAVWNRNPDLLRVLLDHNGPVDVPDANGESALSYAKKHFPDNATLINMLEGEADKRKADIEQLCTQGTDHTITVPPLPPIAKKPFIAMMRK